MANKLQLDLSGGMNANVTPLVLKDNEAELIVNYDLVRAGGIQKRKGYSLIGSQINDNDVRMIAQGGENNRIAVVLKDGSVESTVYRYSAGWTSWKTTIVDSSLAIPPHFEVMFDYTYMVHPADDMLTTTSNVNDSWASVNAPNTSDDPHAAYIKRFGDRMYIASGAASNEGSRLWWSSLPDPTTHLITWDIDNDWADIDPDGNSDITGLDVNGERLLIFKKDAMFRWQFQATQSDRVIGVGAHTQETIRTNYELGITFFAGMKGVFSYSPFSEARPRLISRPIQRWYEANTNSFRSMKMEIDIDNVYLSMGGSITLDGITVTNAVFVYNIPLDAWTMYSFGDTIRAMGQLVPVTGNNTDNPQVHLGTTLGQVMQFKSGTSDNTAPIATRYIGKEYLLNYPEQVQLKAVNTFALTQGSTQIFYDTDRSGRFQGIGQMTGRVTTRRLQDEKCNSVRMSFVDNSIGDALIEGFNFQYEPLPYEQEKPRNIRTGLTK